MKITQRLTALLISSVMLSAAVPSLNTEAARIDCLSLGDSISYGYGLADPSTESYPALISAANGFTLTNESVNGMKSEGLISLLNSGELDTYLAGAEVVTVSIGSNDLLGPFMGYVAEAVGAEDSSSAALLVTINEMLASGISGLFALNNAMTALKASTTDNAELYAICDQYELNLQEIIGLITEKAPAADIYISDIYNPYIDASTVGLDEICAPYIAAINEAFENVTDGYTLFSVYEQFNGGGLTNVIVDATDTSNMNFDPHPNSAGHTTFAAAFNAVYRPIEVVPYGDVNIDGSIDSADYLLLSEFLHGCEAEISQDYSDIDNDGSFTAVDAALLKRMLIES